MTEPFAFLVLLAIVGALCYFAGWRSARAYTEAATAIEKISKSTLDHAEQFALTLDKHHSSNESLREEVEALRLAQGELAEVTAEHRERITQSMEAVITGLRGSGYAPEASTKRGGFPAQVGEHRTE